MIILETFLMTLLLCTIGFATLIDFKTGLIPNKLLFAAGLTALAANIIYYGFYANEYFMCFVMNLIVMVALSLLLYAYHFWGAGDSKLMMFIVFALPARFYIDSQISIPTLMITIYTFAIAFVYLILESIVLGIKNKNFFELDKKFTLKSVAELIKNCFVSYIYIFLIGFAEMIFLNGRQLNNEYIASLLNFFIVFSIFSFEFLTRWYMITFIAVVDIILYAVFFDTMKNVLPSAFSVIVIAVILIFRSLAEKYNYKTIKTSEVLPGTVLAFSTILLFGGSRVKGLPATTTEDFRSRISKEEADSIKRWENTSTGKHEILIVRKLPFAIFIMIGTITFLILRRYGF